MALPDITAIEAAFEKTKNDAIATFNQKLTEAQASMEEHSNKFATDLEELSSSAKGTKDQKLKQAEEIYNTAVSTIKTMQEEADEALQKLCQAIKVTVDTVSAAGAAIMDSPQFQSTAAEVVKEVTDKVTEAAKTNGETAQRFIKSAELKYLEAISAITDS